MEVIKVLFVCTGNICRSPMAEAIFRKIVDEAGFSSVIESDSAGTGDDHIGEEPDRRAIIACRRRGMDISDHRARQITRSDFDEFDLILVMDWENLTELQQRAPRYAQHKLQLLMRYANDNDEAVVPDPFYGLNEGFNRVYEYCTDACTGLMETLEKRAKQLMRQRSGA